MQEFPRQNIKIKSISNKVSPIFIVEQGGQLTLNNFDLFTNNMQNDATAILNEGLLNLTKVTVFDNQNINATSSSIRNVEGGKININENI